MKEINDLLNFGIIVIDKPAGPTSFSISDYVRMKLKLKKTSHFGTLDPMVTGVLPIALGRACKLTGVFLGHDKTYIGIMHTHKEQDIKNLQQIINKNFLGIIKQTPPKKSRVKRVEREREIKKFELIEESDDKKYFLFLAEVQGGTYIRKLCSDLGEIIEGAHMAELRRIKAGIFDESQAIKLYEFDKLVDENRLQEKIIPAQDAIKMVIPSYEVKDTCVFQLKTGKPLFEEDLVEEKIIEAEQFSVFNNGKFIGIYSKVPRQNNIIAKPSFVFN